MLAAAMLLGAACAPTLDRTRRPEPRPIAELIIPTPERFALDNGLVGHLVTSETLPTVELILDLDVGSVSDPAGKIGLASVCLDLFTEGSERLDKVQWSMALADHAISIYSSAGAERSAIVVRSLVSELDPALDRLAELIRAPGMRAADFERIVANRKASLLQSRATPKSVAWRLIPALAWGDEHPYGRIQLDAHLDALRLDDCTRWVAEHLRPSGATLWVAGKIGVAELRPKLEARLQGWTGTAPTPVEVASAAGRMGTIHAVHIDGAVQSMIMVAHPGPVRTAADYTATHLMAQIFGGGFSSRVNMNLREDKGYAYGARGRFSYYRWGSSMTISSSVEATSTALALREIAKETELMRSQPPTRAELERERDNARLALPARFAKSRSTLSELRSLAFYGLPLDWHAGYQVALDEIDVRAVLSAARAHLAPRGVVVLVVGDLSKPARDAGGATIRDELKRLADEEVFGGGGLVVLDVDGNPQ